MRDPRVGVRLRLLLLSFLMLFTELLLIRFAAAQVVYLAYFTNFVLLASFLGIGLGFLRPKAVGEHVWERAPIALAGLLLFLTVFPVHVGRADGRSFAGPLGMPPMPLALSLAVIFVGVTLALAALARSVAIVFAQLAPLEAYRLDIGGSLLGIVVFTSLSFFGLPPVVWGLVWVAVALLATQTRQRWERVGLGGVVALLLLASLSPHDRWSPYYRVTASDPDPSGVISISVNGLPHQSIVPVSKLRTDGTFYFDPYPHLAGPPKNVLIVGAGSGNDVAVALAEGAQHIDAVEIDPVIRSIGTTEHPDHPYQDPRVSLFTDDGRAFIERSHQTYDLIEFALPDSLTVVSGQGSLRLESYLFTLEALRDVRAHLAPGGAFTMYNYYRSDVFQRFAATVQEAFGQPPCIDRRGEQLGPRQQAVLTVGRDPGDISCEPPAAIDEASGTVATDDHPFPYLSGRTIPLFYLVVLLLILVASAGAIGLSGVRMPDVRGYADLFFMGVAFLLLETKNVVQFALLFGTTWFVNALVFTGILLAVLAAIEVARRRSLPRPVVLYAGLGLALAAAAAVPSSSLLSLSVGPRFMAAVLLAFSPVFMANLVFAQRFKDVATSTTAFGVNLLGAMVGGVLEYLALITGYRALLLVVAGAYGLAFLMRPRHQAAS